MPMFSFALDGFLFKAKASPTAKAVPLLPTGSKLGHEATAATESVTRVSTSAPDTPSAPADTSVSTPTTTESKKPLTAEEKVSKTEKSTDDDEC